MIPSLRDRDMVAEMIRKAADDVEGIGWRQADYDRLADEILEALAKK